MDSLKKKNVTVQGVMTPVPAVIGSEQAGSRPSSSSDRNVTPVNSLAEVTDKATSAKEKEREGTADIFKRSNKLVRSPPGTPSRTPSRTPSESVRHTASQHSEAITAAKGSTTPFRNPETPLQVQISPREELISRARKEEEQSLVKCRAVLNYMRSAVMKQKNVSMDIKKGISELDELFDVIDNHRRSWKKAENEQQSRNRLQILLAEKRQEASVERIRTASLSKRSASSPPKEDIAKKHKADVEEGWQTVAKKKNGNRRDKVINTEANEETGLSKRNQTTGKKVRKRLAKHRLDAVVVKPAEGHSYADVLRKLKANVRPEDAEVTVRSVRKTKTGALLLEVAKGGRVEKFAEAIKKSLKEDAVVRDLKPRITIEIRDVDCTSTQEEVIAAICEKTGAAEGDITARLTDLNTWNQRRAFVQLPLNNAEKLLQTQRIKIGWTHCRIKYLEEKKRCFKCFGHGHEQRECRGPDRKGRGICIRCGEEGHILKQCVNPPKCCICVEQGKYPVDHVPGSRSCRADIQL